MPELPDVLLYVNSLTRLLRDQPVRAVSIRSPFVLRTVSPSIDAILNRKIEAFSRRGKRIVWHFEGDLFLVVHLMVAGRLHWRKPNTRPRGKNDLAAFEFEGGTMLLTEASQKKRAGIWCLDSLAQVSALDPGGLDVLSANDDAISQALLRRNNTLKRALADPHRFDGIGNAYSDEILHAARLSPLKRTQQLDDDELARLCAAMRATLRLWIDRLAEQNRDGFPEKVTAFRPEMAVHGKFEKACPVCAAPVQRIRYAENECNYCPRCQVGGRILADRSLSRLLKDDWPRSLDELDQ